MTALLLLLLVLPGPGDPPCVADPVIETTVAGLLGVESGLSVQTSVCQVAADVAIDAAIPEPGARLGRPARFRLMNDGRQVGYAVSAVSGPIRHLRSTRTVPAATVLADADIEERTSVLDGELLQPLPTRADVVGLTATRTLAESDVITSNVVRIPPAVRSGDRVRIRSTVGPVEAHAIGTAQQSGRIGDVIRLVNAETRRALRGRIVARGEVEVIHGS